MDYRKRIKEIRESTGMNRREFCEYFQIPYRTVTEWELDNRHAPEYVIRLLEYYIRTEGLDRKADKATGTEILAPAIENTKANAEHDHIENVARQ